MFCDGFLFRGLSWGRDGNAIAGKPAIARRAACNQRAAKLEPANMGQSVGDAHYICIHAELSMGERITSRLIASSVFR